MQANGEDRALTVTGSHTSHAFRLRVFAVTASLCLHFLLIIAAIRYGEFEIIPAPNPALTIGLVPDNPLLREPAINEMFETETPTDLAVVEEADIPPEEPVETAVVVEEIPAQTPADELMEETLAEIPTLELVESTESEPAPESAPAIEAPSIVTIQNRVSDDLTQQQIESREWANICTQLQRVSGVLGCQQLEETDYQAAEVKPQRQSVYEFHNPPVVRSRSERSLATIASRTSDLSASLAMADLPAGLSDYLMAEVEAGVSLYSNRADPVQDNMDRMVDQSAASQTLEPPSQLF